MRRPATITTPFATAEETARFLGVPARRAKELIQMVEESLAKKGYPSANGRSSTAGKNGTGNRASRSHRAKMKARAAMTVKPRASNGSRRKLTRAKAKNSH